MQIFIYRILNISKSVSGKYRKIVLDHVYQPVATFTIKVATDAFENVTKWVIETTAEVTGELIGNKKADKVTRTASSKTEDIKLD